MKLASVACLVISASAAQALDVKTMITECEAPITEIVSKVAESDANSPEWNSLNLAILNHRKSCAVPLALRCHLSDSPDACFAGVTDAFDMMAEKERSKLESYKASNGTLFGSLGSTLERTTDARAKERRDYCGSASTDASTYVRSVGGNAKAACELEIAVGQWASMAWSGAAPKALSLLPPAGSKE